MKDEITHIFKPEAEELAGLGKRPADVIRPIVPPPARPPPPPEVRALLAAPDRGVEDPHPKGFGHLPRKGLRIPQRDANHLLPPLNPIPEFRATSNATPSWRTRKPSRIRA